MIRSLIFSFSIIFGNMSFAKNFEDYFEKGFYLSEYKNPIAYLANSSSIDQSNFRSLYSIGKGDDFQLIFQNEEGKQNVVRFNKEPITDLNNEIYKDNFIVEDHGDFIKIKGEHYDPRGWFLLAASYWWISRTEYEVDICKQNKHVMRYKTVKQPLLIMIPFVSPRSLSLPEIKGLATKIEASYPYYKGGGHFRPAC